MTGLLIRLFIKNHENTQEASVRTAYGKLSGVVGIVCNMLLFGAKFLAGAVSGSVSIMADAINNLSDASSSVISLLGFKMASKPADEEHPYGHARYEYIAGLAVAVLIIVIGTDLFKTSLKKIIKPETVEFSFMLVGVLLVAILIKIWLALFNHRLGKAIDSTALLATAMDSRNDVVSTAAVLAATIISHMSGINLDGWVGLLVAAFILYSGIGLIKDTLDPLLGMATDAGFAKDVQQKVLSYPQVLGTHDLIVHDYGPGRRFASVHVEMAAENDVLECHEIIDTIERDFLEKEHIHLIIHYDPIVTSDDAVGELRHYIDASVKEMDERLSIHDLRIVPGNERTNVIFDCVVPHEFQMDERTLRAIIDKKVKEKYSDYYCVITIDHSFAAIPRQ